MKKMISKLAKGAFALAVSASTLFSVTTVSAQEQILLWHSMGAQIGERFQDVVDQFNESQSEYQVVAEFQGTYDESTASFFQLQNSSGRPAIIQIGEQNLQSIYDSGLATPLNDLMDKYNFSSEDLFEGIVNFYSINNDLYAMPFNASSPVLFYNKEALEKAGFTEAPQTYEDILAMADAIAEHNDGMKVFAMHPYGYALEQMVTNVGGFVVNNDNGRTSRATEVAYEPEMTRIFEFFAELVSKGQFGYYGTSFDDVLTAVNNNEVAMFIHTSALARPIIDSFGEDMGVAYLPVFEDTERLGVYAAGGALAVANNLSEEEEAGVMAFLEFATSPDIQAFFAGGTGYFAVNTKAYETETMLDIFEQYPQLKVASDQFLESKQTPQTAGPLLQILPQLRSDLNTAVEMVFSGGDVQQAIDFASETTNVHIQNANASVTE